MWKEEVKGHMWWVLPLSGNLRWWLGLVGGVAVRLEGTEHLRRFSETKTW